MRAVALRLQKAGISEARYRELMWFCYQYEEKREMAEALA